jgi:hypothetical protein
MPNGELPTKELSWQFLCEENCQAAFDRAVAGITSAGGGDDGFLLGEERRVPEERDGGRDSVVAESEKAAASLGDSCRYPLRLGSLGVDAQEH